MPKVKVLWNLQASWWPFARWAAMRGRKLSLSNITKDLLRDDNGVICLPPSFFFRLFVTFAFPPLFSCNSIFVIMFKVCTKFAQRERSTVNFSLVMSSVPCATLFLRSHCN
uniref:Uncharacterized protein n=1 Tax=Trypanosoma vivax (strain Y486) TaxID=1055687 RepID=G0UAS8_TRYVY|nr:hypothetical protein TVY486_1103980 [Trypanosoma vivax Y486]